MSASCDVHTPLIFNYSNHRKTSSKAQIAACLLIDFRNGGEGGILPEHPKKFSVAMVKLKSFVVNEQIVEKSFCQCHWEI